jgi:hypothetical protein
VPRRRGWARAWTGAAAGAGAPILWTAVLTALRAALALPGVVLLYLCPCCSRPRPAAWSRPRYLISEPGIGYRFVP